MSKFREGMRDGLFIFVAIVLGLICGKLITGCAPPLCSIECADPLYPIPCVVDRPEGSVVTCAGSVEVCEGIPGEVCLSSGPACPACDVVAIEAAYDRCVEANLSMAVALDAIVLREEGCARFLSLDVSKRGGSHGR